MREGNINSEPVVTLIFSSNNKQKWRVCLNGIEIATITKKKDYPFLVTFSNEAVIWDRQFFHINDAVSELMREFQIRKGLKPRRHTINPWDDLQKE